MHPNFPTLKTQRMMRATPSASLMPPGDVIGADGGSSQSGIGGGSQSDVAAIVADEDVCWDYIYSFGALKRLCAKHLKKLKQEERHLKATTWLFFLLYFPLFQTKTCELALLLFRI